MAEIDRILLVEDDHKDVELILSALAENRLANEVQVVSFGPFEFDLSLRRLSKNGDQIALTTGEFSMLKALVRHPRQPLSRDKLAQLARGREFEPFDRSLDVQISRLRKMLEPDPAQPRYIQTVWGVGYVFVPDGAT